MHNTLNDNTELLQICRKYAKTCPPDVMISEPYLPYVPDAWNRVLVLAEAQQLAGPKSKKYLEWLKGLLPEKRIMRLPHDSDVVGVGPWDDGSIKLALCAMFPEYSPNETAVSNAVPWSCCTKQESNKNPSSEMIDVAVKFWRELLEAWHPKLDVVITVGKIAKQVIEKADEQVKVIALRSASRQCMNRAQGLFDKDDLLERYPEVRHAIEVLGLHPDQKPGQIFFACHAVSQARKHLARKKP